MTTRERIHRAMRAASEKGCANLPHCAFKELADFDCTMLCDALVAEFDTPSTGECLNAVIGGVVLPADPAMPPPEVVEAMAKDCRCCSECEEQPPCAGCMAGGMCDHGRCTCGESDEDLDDDFDPLACPGCGGNCQVACR